MAKIISKYWPRLCYGKV